MKKITHNASEIIEFAQNHVNDFQPRDDYKELIELAIIFFGEVAERGVNIRAPCGLHLVPWMVKDI